MQRLAINPQSHGAGVQRIAHQRMANVPHMHANLMRAASVQGALHQTGFFLAGQAVKGGVGFFAG